MKMFKVQIGFDKNGRERFRYFDSIELAVKFVSQYFRRRGVVLSITASAKGISS